MRNRNQNILSFKKIVHRFLFGLIGLAPLTTLAGEVVFDFDGESVTVVDNADVYVFPNRVFVSQFGEVEFGGHVDLDQRYRGFQVTSDSSAIESKTHEDGSELITQIFYGDAVYFQKNKYFFFRNNKTAQKKSEFTNLSPQDVAFAWVLPKDRSERNLASVDKEPVEVEKAFVEYEKGNYKIRGRTLESQTMGVEAIEVNDQVFYVKKAGSEAPMEKGMKELRFNKNQLLWVANSAY